MAGSCRPTVSPGFSGDSGPCHTVSLVDLSSCVPEGPDPPQPQPYPGASVSFCTKLTHPLLSGASEPRSLRGLGTIQFPLASKGFFSKAFVFIVYIQVFGMHAWLCTTCVPVHMWRSEEGITPPGTGVTPDGCWESDRAPLEKQPVL